MLTETQNKRINLLVAATGSVATIKLPTLLKGLSQTNRFNLKVIITKSGTHFIKDQLKTLSQNYQLHFDIEEWNWKQRGDPVLHIELRKWAQALLIAPLSANSLAKISNGICDDLLSLTVRCWDLRSKVNKWTPDLQSGLQSLQQYLKYPIVVCPSMNTMMYQNPITEQQLETIKKRGFFVFGPIQKTLMCGEVGNGAMEEVANIVDFVYKLFQQPKPSN